MTDRGNRHSHSRLDHIPQDLQSSVQQSSRGACAHDKTEESRSIAACVRGPCDLIDSEEQGAAALLKAGLALPFPMQDSKEFPIAQ